MDSVRLRWLVVRNKVTSGQVRAEAAIMGLPMAQAKQRLERAHPPRLQQWITVEQGHEDYVAQGGFWMDVDVVTLSEAQYEAEVK